MVRTILRLEFAKDSSLAKGESAWQAIQINCSMGDDIIGQRVYNVLLCNHVGKEVARTEATCKTDGSIKYQCDTCGTEWVETLPATGHDLTKAEAKPRRVQRLETKNTGSAQSVMVFSQTKMQLETTIASKLSRQLATSQ